MPKTTMWAYPWDLLDEGPRTVATRLRDEVGLDAVSVATAYHTYDQIRPHLRGRLIHADRAYAYFTPRPQYYADTPLRPTPRWPNVERDPMTEIAGALEAAGLDMISWAVTLHNTALGEAHPECCQRNALGDHFTFALCPANPSVRAYLLGLAADLTENYRLARLELESAHYHNFWHVHYHEKVGVEMGRLETGTPETFAAVRYLYGLCFCDSCAARAKAADVDVERLEAIARERVEDFFRTGRPESETPQDILARDPGFSAYADVREEVVASLLQDVRERINCELGVVLFFDRLEGGIGPVRLLEVADTFETMAYSADVVGNERKLRAIVESGVDPQRMLVALCAFPPASPDAQTLVDNTRMCAELGVGDISYYNYGIMTFEHLNWVTQAVTALKKG